MNEIVTSQAPSTDDLPAGQVFSLALLTGPGAIVQRLIAGVVVESVPITASASFGPYLHNMQFRVSCIGGGRVATSAAPQTVAQLTAAQMAAAQALVSGAVNLPTARMVGDDLSQPSSITRAVTKPGKLAARFGSGQWTATTGTPVLTQGYTGWDGSGNKSGITSRTGQPDMLKVVPVLNTSEAITLGTFATNMLIKSLNGRLGLWVYLEAQPGYQVGGTLAGTLEIALTTTGTAYTNGLNIGFNSNAIREGWNFIPFVMRNPQAYVSGSGASEDHPYGYYVTGNGTGADSNILASAVTQIRILWANMNGATMYFDSIWTDFESTPQVVLGCDQGALTEEVALPIFAAYGWTGYVAFPYNTADNNGSTLTVQTDLNTLPFGTQMAQMQRLYAAGWDVINHSMTHAALGSYVTEPPIVYQMEQSRALWLSNDFFRGSEFYASPSSSTSRLSEKVIKGLGYKIQRHSRKMMTTITPFGLDTPSFIGAWGWGSNASMCVANTTSGANSSVNGNQQVSKIKRGIDMVVAYKCGTYQGFWHGITASGDTGSGEDLTGDNLLLTTSAFTLVCAYIRGLEQAGSVEVCKGMSGWYYGSNV